MPAQQQSELPRVLSASHATAIVVGIIIGSGIFLVPREMMAAAGSSSSVYLVWIAGGFLSLCGALTYAEIASGRPAYGGEYAFLREAYGDVAGFLHMWTWFTIAKPASLASICAGLIRTLATFTAFAFFQNVAWAGLTYGQFAALLALWLVTLLDIIGTRQAANVQLALTWLKVLLIFAIGAACFLLSSPSASVANFSTSYAGARGGASGFMVALIAALWAYDGWSDVAAMAGEVKQPQRNLPVALGGGMLIVGGLYMLTNAAIQYVLPAWRLAQSDRPAAEALSLVLHAHGAGWGATLVSIGMVVSIASSFVGSSLSGARIPFAAARDGLFFSKLAQVHPRFHTPVTALITQAALASLLILALARFQALFSLAIFAEWMTYGLAASTIFVFRRKDRLANRRPAFQVPLYPALPLLFLLAAGTLTVFSFYDQPRNSLAGVVIIVCGIPVFGVFRSRRKRIGPGDHALDFQRER